MSRAVGIAAIIWGVTALASRLLGLVRESVIGRILGNGGEADAFFAAFVLPDFLNYLLASGLLSIVFIPLFQARLAEGEAQAAQDSDLLRSKSPAARARSALDEGGLGDTLPQRQPQAAHEAAAWTSFSALFTVVGLLVIGASAALWIAAPDLAPLVAPGLDAQGHARVATLTRIVLPAQIFHVLGGLLSATLQARDRHALPALAPLLYVGGIIVGGLVGQSADGFAWGVLIGSALGPFGLVLIGAVRMGLRYRPRLRHPDVRTWLIRSLPVMLGASVVAVDDWIVKHFASLLEEGAIARLQYARTLMKVPMGVFGMAAGLAAYPTLSRLLAHGDRAAARAMLTKALRATWVLSFAAQAALTVAGTEIATVIWGTDRFTPAQLAEIGRFTAFFCLGVWAWSGALLLARGFYAQGRTWPPTLIGTTVALACLPVYAMLGDTYGGAGLAAASAIAISVYAVLLGIWALRSLGSGDEVGWTFLRLYVACAVGVGAGLGLDQVLPAWPALLRGGITGGIAAALCLGLAVALRVPEARLMIGAVTRRLRR